MTAPTSRTTGGRHPWLHEMTAVIALGWPLALTNLAQIAMTVTDVLMMGRLGPDTIAAGALGSNVYFIPLIVGIGLLNATAPLVAASRGRNPQDHGAVAGIVQQSLWSAVALALPCWAVLWWTEHLLVAMGQDPSLAAEAGRYVRALQWALLPFWGYLVLRSFVGALERPVWALAVGIGGVALNAAGNWCLMLGHCGMAPLGIAGSGLATTLASTAMLVALAIVSTRGSFARYAILRRPWRFDVAVLRALYRLGLPMAATLLFEVTIFNAAVFLMGLIGAAALAAHTIAIQLASLTFMVPLGIGQAATVRVGLAFGRKDTDAIRRAGWSALGLGTAFMGAMALVMLLAPRTLIGAFLDTSVPANAEVVSLATTFLLLAALFQIADGAQAVCSGMLRGLHDARVPMIYALFGYWGFGLPLGWLLAFPLGLGGTGIWIGLAAGLAVVAALMIWRWMRRDALGLVGAGGRR